MRRKLLPLIATMLPVTLAGCGGPAEGTASVNIKAVSDRILKTLDGFDAYLRRYDYKEADAAMHQQFNKTIQHDLNAQPPIHNTKIVTTVNNDASIMGYGDLNSNGKVDAKEPKLFKLEFDGDNGRIIVTSAAHGDATGHTRPRTSGFFAGVMIGSIMNRQSASGVRRGHFDSRKVAGAPVSRKVASNKRGSKTSSRARSRARSGGVRGGK